MLSRSLGRQLVAHSIVRRHAVLAPLNAAAEGSEKAPSVGKTVLAKRLAQENELTLKQAAEIIDALFDDIMLSVAEGNTVTIPGFGSFKKRHRAARKGRNPQTGEDLQIAATDSPAFSAGTVFKGVVKAGSWEALEEVTTAQKAAKAKKK